MYALGCFRWQRVHAVMEAFACSHQGREVGLEVIVPIAAPLVLQVDPVYGTRDLLLWARRMGGPGL